jgi:hypothetical protein
MKSTLSITFVIIFITILTSCNDKQSENETDIIFLHHSTGWIIWGTKTSILTKVAWRFNKLFDYVGTNADLPKMFKEYNSGHNSNYKIVKKPFPKTKPYGWHNYPFDYYNIWVKNAGLTPYMKEPTLEILTSDYEVIIFKHCFPSSNIKPDVEPADINSDYKSIANYKLQYDALRKKLQEFPNTKFILFTVAANVNANTSEEEAYRARMFYEWVLNEWDLPDDNIYIWDLYNLETEGELYLKEEYAAAINDSHPNEIFAKKASKLLFNRIIDVIENNGEETTITGLKK